MAEDYKETLQLPKTTFPMRANLAQREPDFLRFWEEIGLYQKLMAKRKEDPSFILHDGPPYANGNIHIGTAFNKILKDFVCKFKWIRGFRSPYVPGWDTHGLPIEFKVLKEAGVDKDSIDPVELRKRCAAYARHYIDIQREEFKRLGVLGDWQNPYISLLPEYEAAELGALADMVDKGLVYKGKKPVFWCTTCQTAEAAAEIEYADEVSPSIYVAYPLIGLEERFPELKGMDAYVVIWTTTPWTLPAGEAVALHPEYDYTFVEAVDGRVFLLATALLESFAQKTSIKIAKKLFSVKGNKLEGQLARHPFYDDRLTPLVLADYVLLDEGTGCVHTAPGHGVDDFETGIKYGLEVLNPVDDRGYYVKNTPLVGGLSLEEGSEVVLNVLSERGRLLGSGKITHSYPHCWRCKNPVIFRATHQWFIAVSKFKDEVLKIIDNDVQWVPSWGKDRISNMVKDRSDWCISRQRVWGVPITAFYCDDCGEVILSSDRIRRVAEKVRRSGTDIWWTATPEELLGDLAFCPRCGKMALRKDPDIMDVWFDSGSSHIAVLETRPDLQWPADMYLEGSDQHRGWFQTSLLNAVATRGKAPYRAVLTHGFIVDGEGRKMSKSLGNVMAPQEIIGKFGGDILRLWVASSDYRNDIRISQPIINNLVESYRRIRNTARFLLANLSDFDPSKDLLPSSELESLDRWLVAKLKRVTEKATKEYEDYEFHAPTFVIHQFCDNDLSSFYLDVSKDRLYADEKTGRNRRSCQTVMWKTLSALVRMLAPVLSFTCEEVWQEMRKVDPSLPESVFLSDWPTFETEVLDTEAEKLWDRIIEVRGAILRGLEEARAKELIGHPLDAKVRLKLSEEFKDLAVSVSPSMWEMAAIVSEVEVVDPSSKEELPWLDALTGISLEIEKSTYEKCPRCWRRTPEVAEKGLCSRCLSVLHQA